MTTWCRGAPSGVLTRGEIGHLPGRPSGCERRGSVTSDTRLGASPEGRLGGGNAFLLLADPPIEHEGHRGHLALDVCVAQVRVDLDAGQPFDRLDEAGPHAVSQLIAHIAHR